MNSYISRFGVGVYIFDPQIFHQPAPHFYTSVSPFFLPVLSSDNSLSSNHTAFKSVFLKVMSYNYILIFFPTKEGMRGEKEDHYSCIILAGLKTSQMRQNISPYIK